LNLKDQPTIIEARPCNKQSDDFWQSYAGIE